jgi:quinol-cytochrome oxidoreductase complex cytochrome b subunit
MNKIIMIRNYTTTILLSPTYSLGFCAFIFIIIQLITGFILACNYIPSTFFSFHIINNIIMRELDLGFLLRYIHINGCAFLFIIIYMHIFRSIYKNSISKYNVYIIGIIIYIILCGISFTGYSLVFGQLSYWAIVVICNLITCIPFIGHDLLIIVWGGNIINDNTIQRIFSFHFILPFFIIFLIIIHLIFLHIINSTGDIFFIINKYNRINFYPLLLFRDLFIINIFFIFFYYILFFLSDIFNHTDNYIFANPLITPNDIMPEFYLLFFYAIIRSIPFKTLGIFFLFSFIFFLLLYSNFSFFYFNFNIYRFTTFFIFLLDIFIISYSCLFINHFQSFYIILIFSFISFFFFNFIFNFNISLFSVVFNTNIYIYIY